MYVYIYVTGILKCITREWVKLDMFAGVIIYRFKHFVQQFSRYDSVSTRAI